MEAKLVVVGGKANMGEVKLRLPMTIGRGHKADLIISHPTVSRIHCELREENGALFVRDNGSSNGTFLDDEKIEEAIVQPGQILKIGPLTFRAEYETADVVTDDEKPVVESGMAQTETMDRADFDFLIDEEVGSKEEAPVANTQAAAKKPSKEKTKSKSPVAPPAPTTEIKQTDEFDLDLSDLGLDEPVASSSESPSSQATVAEPAPTIDLPPSDEVEAPAAAGEDDLDFDFLSDIEPEKPTPEVVEMPPVVETKSPPPPVAKAPVVETKPVEEETPLVASEPEGVETNIAPPPSEPAFDDLMFEDAASESPAVAEIPDVAPQIEPEVAATAEGSDLDVDAWLSEEPASPSAVEPMPPAVPASEPEAAKIEVVEKSEVDEEPPAATADEGFDFSFLDNEQATVAPEAPTFEPPVQDVAATIEFPPTLETPTDSPAVEESAEEALFDELFDAPEDSAPAASTPEETASTEEEAAFDFLDEPAAESISPPMADATPSNDPAVEIPATSAADDPNSLFDFEPVAPRGLERTIDFVAEQPAPSEPAFDFNPIDESPSDDTPSFDAPADAEAPAAKTADESMPTFDAEEPAAAAPSFAPTAKSAKKPAAKKLSIFDKMKKLLGGKKSAASPQSKQNGSVADLEQAASAAGAPFVVPKFTPSPIDEAPIPLFDTGPSTPVADETAATSEPVAPSEAAFDEDLFASTPAPSDVSDVAAPMADGVPADSHWTPTEPSIPLDDALDDLFSDEVPVSPVAETAATDEAPLALDDAAPSATPRSEDEFDFTAEWSAETATTEPAPVDVPMAESDFPEIASADVAPFELSPPEAPVAETLNGESGPGDSSFEELFGEDEPHTPFEEPAPTISSAAPAPTAAPRTGRPQWVDVDVRLTSSHRSPARVAVKAPRVEVPHMEPDPPAGRSFNGPSPRPAKSTVDDTPSTTPPASSDFPEPVAAAAKPEENLDDFLSDLGMG